MPIALGLLLFVLTVVAMEGVAYGVHRWVMHSALGWTLHASHHRARHGWFEANDLYASVFAAPSIALFYAAGQGLLGGWANWVGAGVAAYGAIYFGFHDVIVHRRIAHHIVPRSAWLRRIVQAHRLHHVVEARRGAVSFGFLWAPPVDRLKAALAARGRDGLRAPRPNCAAGSTNPPATSA